VFGVRRVLALADGESIKASGSGAQTTPPGRARDSEQRSHQNPPSPPSCPLTTPKSGTTRNTHPSGESDGAALHRAHARGGPPFATGRPGDGGIRLYSHHLTRGMYRPIDRIARVCTEHRPPPHKNTHTTTTTPNRRPTSSSTSPPPARPTRPTTSCPSGRPRARSSPRQAAASPLRPPKP
jgi:hypothetical protein